LSQNATDAHKRLAAAAALEFVRPDARLGLGTGSTATHFVALLGEEGAIGRNVITVAVGGSGGLLEAFLGQPFVTGLVENPSAGIKTYKNNDGGWRIRT